MARKLKYIDAVHAMQSGVAMMINYDSHETDPKHLRVGVNSAMCDQAALARLLIGKGLFTLQEYEQAVEDEMNREVDRYENKIRKQVGSDSDITLH